jgi:hypothetical protein
VSGVISAVNPIVLATVEKYTGSVQGSDYKQSPAYAEPENVTIQVQPLSSDDLVQISGLNIQGEKKAFYSSMRLRASSRPDQLGGDLVTLPDATKWLVVHELEDWSATAGWCKIAVKRQL